MSGHFTIIYIRFSRTRPLRLETSSGNRAMRQGYMPLYQEHTSMIIKEEEEEEEEEEESHHSYRQEDRNPYHTTQRAHDGEEPLDLRRLLNEN
jgi:hypothetical protein